MAVIDLLAPPTTVSVLTQREREREGDRGEEMIQSKMYYFILFYLIWLLLRQRLKARIEQYRMELDSKVK